MKKLIYLSLALIFTGCFGVSEDEKQMRKLKENLSTSVEELSTKNEDVLKDIREAVERDSKKASPPEIIALINTFEKKKDSTMDFIDEIIDDLLEIGERDETGALGNPKDIEKSEAYLLGKDPSDNLGRGNGLAFELGNVLTDFTAVCNQIGNALPEFKPPHHSDTGFEKTWEYDTFHGKPLIARLAQMEKYKLDASSMAYDVLNHLRTSLTKGGTVLILEPQE